MPHQTCTMCCLKYDKLGDKLGTGQKSSRRISSCAVAVYKKNYRGLFTRKDYTSVSKKCNTMKKSSELNEIRSKCIL